MNIIDILIAIPLTLFAGLCFLWCLALLLGNGEVATIQGGVGSQDIDGTSDQY